MTSAGARISRLCLLALALAAVTLTGCRQATPPAPKQGWVRLSAMLPLHPNQPMLDDIDHRLATLAEQRTRLLQHPTLPLPADVNVLDTPSLEQLPAPEAAQTPSWPQTAISPKLAELRQRLTEEMTIRYQRLNAQLDSDRQTTYQLEEQDLLKWADGRRREVTEAYRQRIPEAKMRLALVEETLASATRDAKAAQADADIAHERLKEVAATQAAKPGDAKVRKALLAAEERVRQSDLRAANLTKYAAEQQTARDAIANQYAADQQALSAAQGEVRQQMEDKLQAYARELTEKMNARLQAWREREERELDRQVTERAAQLEAENLPPTYTEPPRKVELPEMPARPLYTQSDRMRIAVNTADFKALHARTDAVRAIDDTMQQLTQERRNLVKTIAQDTRLAALSAAAQHGWNIQFDKPAGPDVTDTVRRWLTAYWPAND